MVDKDPNPYSERLKPKTPLRTDSIQAEGEGLTRYTLLNGKAVRTRITVNMPGYEEFSFIIAGGSTTNDGTNPGDRPPLLIHDPAFKKAPENNKGVAISVLPFGSKTFRSSEGVDGVYVGSDFVLGTEDDSQNFGIVKSLDFVPDIYYGTADELPSQLDDNERDLIRSFYEYESVISSITRFYSASQHGVTPPSIQP